MVAVLTYARQLGFCRSTPPTIPHSRNQLVNKTAGQAAVAESWADRVSPGAVTHATGAMCPTLGAHQFEPNQVATSPGRIGPEDGVLTDETA